MKKFSKLLVLVLCFANGFGQDNLEQVKNDFSDKSVIKDFERTMKKYGDGYSSAYAKNETIQKRYEKLKVFADAGYAPAQYEYALCIKSMCYIQPESLQDGLMPETRGKLMLGYFTKSAEQFYVPALDWLIEDKVYSSGNQCIVNRLTSEQIKFWTNKKGEIELMRLKKQAESGDVFAPSELALKYFLANDEKNAIIWGLKPEVYKWLESSRNDTHSYNDNNRKFLAFLDAQKLKNNTDTNNFSDTQEAEEGFKFYRLADYNNAFIWLKKAADKGNINTQSTIGNMYYNGQGVALNYQFAFDYWTKASDKGEPNARLNLGYFCYFLGQGITPNPQKAYDLLKSINDKSFVETDIYKNKLIQINEGIDFLKTEKLANLGDASAMVTTGLNYQNGNGTNASETKAMEYFNKAIAKGGTTAEVNVADLLILGKTTTHDYNKAFQIIQKYENSTNKLAHHLLGVCYFYGRGTVRDYKKSRDNFNPANIDGGYYRTYYYAYFYFNGVGGVEKNLTRAKDELEITYRNRTNDEEILYVDIINQIKYERSLVVDVCPVCKGSGVTTSGEAFTYSSQESTGKMETVRVYDMSTNSIKDVNRPQTSARSNTGFKYVEHTCSRCNGTGKVHRN